MLTRCVEAMHADEVCAADEMLGQLVDTHSIYYACIHSPNHITTYWIVQIITLKKARRRGKVHCTRARATVTPLLPPRELLSSDDPSSLRSHDSFGAKSGVNGGNRRRVREPVGIVLVHVIEARDVPVPLVKNARESMQHVCVVTVRGEEIIRTPPEPCGQNPTWGVKGQGAIWEDGDTIEVCVLELSKGVVMRTVGSGRLYVNEVWGSAQGAVSGAETECQCCNGLGCSGPDEHPCHDCAATGLCHDSWMRLEVCACLTARVRVRCKFKPTKGVQVNKAKAWHAARGDEILDSEMARVSAHDAAAAIAWHKQIRMCRETLNTAMQPNMDAVKHMTLVLKHAKALGIYLPGEDALEPPGENIGANTAKLCQDVKEKLDALRTQEQQMPFCAASLQGTVSLWSGLRPGQRASMVGHIAATMERDLTSAARIGMHRVHKYRGTVEAAMLTLAEIESVLDAVRVDTF
jgi:hypothetical protein